MHLLNRAIHLVSQEAKVHMAETDTVAVVVAEEVLVAMGVMAG